MQGRHIPYLVGGFMLLPYGFSLILWAFFLPGPKHGFDQAMSVAMFGASLPLVFWFFLANLGFISNSIAGENPFQHPASRWVRWTLTRLPALAVLIGIACVPYLLVNDEPPLLIPLPVLVALLVAWAIHRGEAARREEVRDSAGATASRVSPLGRGLQEIWQVVLQALFLVPGIGWMLREAVQGRDEDRTFFSLNLALLTLLAVLIFGFQALFFAALACVPIAFLLILLLTLE